MPEWLLKSETYTAPVDQDTFVNKSILALLRVLSRIHAQGGKQNRFSVHPVYKVACTLLLILLTSLSGSFSFVLIMLVYLLLAVSLMPARDIIRIGKVSLLMTLFSLLILLPSALMGNTYSTVMITCKILTTVTAVNLLSHSSRWNSITGALKYFYLPDIFILVLDITIKYILMLGDFTLNLLYSLKLRSIGKNRRKYSSLSGIVGITFIRSKEMAEDLYSAMECRGYTGEYRRFEKLTFSPSDFFYLLLNAIFIFAFFYFART